MADKHGNQLMAQSKTTATTTLRTLADAIEAGNVSRYEINQTSEGSITIKADSSDGKSRMVRTQKEADGYTRISTEHIQKLSAEQRRKTVKTLSREGMNQTQIAERTMYSQKTVSNDLRMLRDQGEI